MGLRMFRGKNIFFEETHHYDDKNYSAQQTQQNYADTNSSWEQLIQKKIHWNNKQQKD